ncbi:beta-glucosidase BglX [Parvularcula sp. ZS-1/3]|uniref:Beta-D-glucoside glucohydrolase n=1 Tax=Parvularcula mediterranea TaxID=2732508 RepID=A0A7Y3RL85_9PROT|nr:beta-glucosidase BglX [Parvularcula mediterranea]NNU16169.1 beta-glucosidase BglX [Parvularcula mediterranea]
MKTFLAAAAASTSLLAHAAIAQDTIAEKVDALLAEMTMEEKVGQLTQYSAAWEVTGSAPTGESEVAKRFRHVESGLVGSMLNVIGTDQVRTIQEYAVENSRLGIPMIFAYDVIHGHRTSFPLPLAEAASWDMELIEEGARVAAREAAAQGLNWTFAPMIDISRDARWGRVMEGAGEDPFLGSEIAVARVNGFQGDDLSDPLTIAATAKHFAGYGFAESGKDYNAAEVGTVTLWNVIFPPFKAAIERANVRTVMNAFNTVNGVPATGDEWMQRDILKGEWGFDGFVVSDWGSAVEMIDHGFAADREDAAKLAIIAGSDMDMESYVFRDHLEGLVETGAVDEALIDDAVRRVLTVKYELGLFDDPYRYIDEGREEALLMAEEHVMAARKMAEASVVLLKNEGDLLPLSTDDDVVIIGALAADKDAPIGNWRAQAEAKSAVSVLEGLDAIDFPYTYVEGAKVQIGDAGFGDELTINMEDRSGFDDAVKAAAAADKVVLVLGETALMSGEGRSRAGIKLPGVQQELLEAVHEANPNTILWVMGGRPQDLSWADENVPAIFQGWHLGHESGNAVASILTGAYNPSGKLPMTFPRAVGQVPIYYNALNTGRPGPKKEVFWQHYTDMTNDPLYPFGHGLSYTDFDYSRLRARQRGENVEVSVRVRNTGDMAGQEVAQLYIWDRAATVARPIRELKGFEKFELAPGKTKTVSFTLTPDELGFYKGDGSFVTEPGAFDIFVGGSSAAELKTTIDYKAE